MSAAALTICKGIPVLFLFTGHLDCRPVKADAEPQAVVCSMPRVPTMTPEEKKGVPQVLRRYILKNEGILNDNHCPPRAKSNEKRK